MIKRLKVKFVILAMSSLVLLMAVIVTGMNVINYTSLVEEADEILWFLSQNKGAFPVLKDKNKAHMRFPNKMSPETPYESRYFSVLLNENGNVMVTETSRIISVNENAAIEHAEEVMDSKNERGFIGDFRYLRSTEDGNTRITFLDCGRRLDVYRTFLYTSIGMACVGLVTIFVVILFCSGKSVKPVAESYEKQKRFITDAGHEIKTPLTIINANVDLLEMDTEENECLNEVRQQTERLTALTNDLVYLARMEEAENSLEKVEIPISDIIQETVAGFQAIAQTQEKEFVCHIQPMLSMEGNHKAIQQLISILLDNALKYSPKGGIVEVHFARVNRNLQLNIYNTTEMQIEPASLNHVFERFYRSDNSRNSETGGHGIGLSVAKAVVAAHGGKIWACTKDGKSFCVMVEFS